MEQVLASASDNLQTFKRIHGVLSVINEEILDSPLYYTLANLSGVLHAVTPPMLAVR